MFLPDAVWPPKRPHKHPYDLPELLGPTNRQCACFTLRTGFLGSLTSIPAALRSTHGMFPIQPMIKTEVCHKERPINKGSLGASARANLSIWELTIAPKVRLPFNIRLLERCGAHTFRTRRQARTCHRPYKSSHQMRGLNPTYSDSSNSPLGIKTNHKPTWNYSLKTSASRSSRKNNLPQ